MKKVLIFYASIGSGHQTAADAIRSALEEIDSNVLAVCVDSLNQTKTFSMVKKLLIIFSQQVAPRIYSWLWFSGYAKPYIEFFLKQNYFCKHILSTLNDFAPDAIVCTHAMPCWILSQYKNLVKIPVYAVTTDYLVHPYWPTNNVRKYFVANDKAKIELIIKGISSEAIKPYGIPIKTLRTNIRKKSKNLLVLVVAGSKTSTAYVAIQKKVINLLKFLKKSPTTNLDWIFIFGENKSSFEKASQIAKGIQGIELKEYVDDLSKLIYISDLVIAKPGGLIIAESLALGKPILLLNKGAGQETANSKFILESGSGLLITNGENLFDFIKNLDNNPELLKIYRNNARKYGKRDASKKIADFIYHDISP